MMDTASSNYNSLEGKLNQRFSNGLVYSVGITWMKSIDYGSAVRGGKKDKDKYVVLMVSWLNLLLNVLQQTCVLLHLNQLQWRIAVLESLQ
jgi:hypothetical protein